MVALAEKTENFIVREGKNGYVSVSDSSGIMVGVKGNIMMASTIQDGNVESVDLAHVIKNHSNLYNFAVKLQETKEQQIAAPANDFTKLALPQGLATFAVDTNPTFTSQPILATNITLSTDTLGRA